MNQESLRYLQKSLSRIDPLIRAAVTHAHAAGHDPTDSLRGLIISDDEVALHLGKETMAGLWNQNETPQLPSIRNEDGDLPFLHLLQIFNLNDIDAYILLVCAAPEFDRRYERLYAFLQDDIAQRRPTVNLVMNLLGTEISERFAVYERLSETMPLRTQHLIECLPDPNQPRGSFLANQCKIDHRVVRYLLGDALPDSRLKHALRPGPQQAVAALSAEQMRPVRRIFRESPLLYFQGVPEAGQVETAAALCAEHELPLLTVDLHALQTLTIDFELACELALREGLLAGSALLFDGWEHALDEETQQPAETFWRALLNYPWPVFLCGREEWEARDAQRQRHMLRLRFEVPAYEARRAAWQTLSDTHAIPLAEPGLDELANKFRFTQSQIVRAVRTAADLALTRGETIQPSDLIAGAQAQSALRLGQYAKRILPRYTWDDLILPPEQLSQLHEMEARARHAHTVLETWGYARKVKPVAGVSALFAGESGTGKTLSAEVIARGLGLVLYKIDLSAVVSKYIGETEKNLSSIFSEARASNAILFFDEADALFGKRSEVKDARDRYANIEIAYLLQQIEDYDGIAILATNLRQNLDEAFTRRLDFMIDFPFPEPEYRYHIWKAHFPAQAPVGSDVDLRYFAENYELAGGNIRNVALAAAYLAAENGGQIHTEHIRSAIRREHQKMGRLLEDWA